ncbi:MAG TPA: glycerol acyltransferase [Deltaproteobacteria bacterium]|nr:glycerol acyltransferase [Deltaproteobacteria bacterium]
MSRTIFDASIPNLLLCRISSFLLRMFGWRKEGNLPDIPKYVMIGAPHTSSWDFPITLAYAFAFKVKVFWMGKETLFRRPFGRFMRWCGGIPIDRTKSNNTVAQTVQLFNNLEKLVMIISPEGTRKKVGSWKTGFYHIADGAKVPILLGFLDYRRKAGGFGPLIFPSGDMINDMEAIRGFYETVTGKHPELESLVRVRMISRFH